MKQSPSWDACRCSALQEIHLLLWHSKVRYRVHKISPLDHILREINPIYISVFTLSERGILKTHITKPIVEQCLSVCGSALISTEVLHSVPSVREPTTSTRGTTSSVACIRIPVVQSWCSNHILMTHNARFYVRQPKLNTSLKFGWLDYNRFPYRIPHITWLISPASQLGGGGGGRVGLLWRDGRGGEKRVMSCAMYFLLQRIESSYGSQRRGVERSTWWWWWGWGYGYRFLSGGGRICTYIVSSYKSNRFPMEKSNYRGLSVY